LHSRNLNFLFFERFTIFFSFFKKKKKEIKVGSTKDH
jgi:hypothetical protein